jgi:hypothetical protein
MTLIAIDVWSARVHENNLGHLRQGGSRDPLRLLPGRVFDGEVHSIGLGISAGQAPAAALPSIDNDHG